MEYEGWSFVDSLYFVMVTVTAVGYGDMTPTDNLSKIFTVVYVALGLLVLAFSLGTWSGALIRLYCIARDCSITYGWLVLLRLTTHECSAAAMTGLQ